MGKYKTLWTACFLALVGILSSCFSGTRGMKQGQQHPEEAFILIQREIGKNEGLPEKEFSDYMTFAGRGPVIPGLVHGFIPQGMEYLPEHESVVISNYMLGDRASALTLVSMQDGELEKVLWLHNKDGSRHRGHMGGVAATKKHLWLASGKYFYKIPLEKITKATEDPGLSLGIPLSTEVKCSFATASGSVLYIGEFRTWGRRYSTKTSHTYKTAHGSRNHALMAGFVLDEQTDSIKASMIESKTAYPSFFISIPDKVQGAAFMGEYVILSQSYGRKNNSYLSFYRNPLFKKEQDTFTFENGEKVPVWHLDGSNHVKTISAPPMTEGIANFQGELAVLFESGSDKYRRNARFPQDRIQILDIGTIMD